MYFDISYRVPYADTDQMGVVYYANYLEYFERSRTELLRSAGLPYSELERLGLFLPVSEAHCRYLAPAHYDDLLTLRSWVAEVKGVRLRIESEFHSALARCPDARGLYGIRETFISLQTGIISLSSSR